MLSFMRIHKPFVKIDWDKTLEKVSRIMVMQNTILVLWDIRDGISTQISSVLIFS